MKNIYEVSNLVFVFQYFQILFLGFDGVCY
jgi:hypothetical protein